jgi:hypothetical protein
MRCEIGDAEGSLVGACEANDRFINSAFAARCRAQDAH